MEQSFKKYLVLLVCLFLTIFLVDCTTPKQKSFNSPYDPLSDVYDSAIVVITGGPDSLQIFKNTRSVSFNYRATNATEFLEYKLNTMPNWVNPLKDSLFAYVKDSTLIFPQLDDDTYTIFFQAKHKNKRDSASVKPRTFKIDSLSTPSLFLSPGYQRVKRGSTNSIYCKVKEIPALLSSRVIITYDKNLVTVDSFATVNSFLKKNGGTPITFVKKDSGKVEVNLAVAMGSPLGVSGTGALFELIYKTNVRGVATFQFLNDSTVAKDTADRVITMQSFDKATIYID
ncbi:MAG: cohesin domain-containing protein [Bacteroidetes bacterium]|nr:cohesin domain-containing protein [Bacteroidota bacterium]